MVDHSTAGTPRLLPPGTGAGFVAGLSVPGELYWVLRTPAPLAGMSYPTRARWTALHEAGFRHVVCLTHDAPRYDPAPLVVRAAPLQEMIVTPLPDAPDRERAVVLDTARFVVDRLRRGEGVVVHCLAGRGRTGTVIGSALVMLGHDPGTTVDWLHRTMRTRNRAGWPEQPWQRDVVLTCLAG